MILDFYYCTSVYIYPSIVFFHNDIVWAYTDFKAETPPNYSPSRDHLCLRMNGRILDALPDFWCYISGSLSLLICLYWNWKPSLSHKNPEMTWSQFPSSFLNLTYLTGLLLWKNGKRPYHVHQEEHWVIKLINMKQSKTIVFQRVEVCGKWPNEPYWNVLTSVACQVQPKLL